MVVVRLKGLFGICRPTPLFANDSSKKNLEGFEWAMQGSMLTLFTLLASDRQSRFQFYGDTSRHEAAYL
jgi:hypothetical protein